MKGEDIYKEMIKDSGSFSAGMKRSMRGFLEHIDRVDRKIDKYQKQKKLLEARLADIRGMTLVAYAKTKEPQKPKED